MSTRLGYLLLMDVITAITYLLWFSRLCLSASKNTVGFVTSVTDLVPPRITDHQVHTMYRYHVFAWL